MVFTGRSVSRLVWTFAAAASFLCISGTAYPAVHELAISAPVLTESDPNCPQEASRIGQAFAQQSGVTIIEVACGYNQISDPTAFIKYSAPTKVSTFNPNAAMFDLHAVGYATAGECAEILAREIPLFVKHTGLQPFASYCHIDTNMIASRKFRPAIYAINTGNQITGRKYSTGTHLDNLPVDPAAVSAVAFDLGHLAGLDMLWTGIGQGFSSLELTATYYSSEELHLHSASFGYVNPQVGCDEMAANLTSHWAGKGPVENVFFCMDATNGALRIGSLWWSPSYLAEDDFTVTRFATRHADFTTCEAARESTVAELRRAGENVLGSLCSHIAFPDPKRPLPPMQVTVITAK